MLIRFFHNHVLANLTFVLVLTAGALAYLHLPKEQNPPVNFNWVQISTVFPGASAEDVEKLITEPLEDALRQVQDIRFASSTSREDLSLILVRFQDINERTYDKRVTDLRREVQSKANQELPEAAEEPEFFELSTANMFPAAMILVSGVADNEVLRRNARIIQEDLERIPGVKNVGTVGLRDPELQVEFSPRRLYAVGATPEDLAETVAAYFQDAAAGSVRQANQQWLIRLVGTSSDPQVLGRFPLKTALGETPINSVAAVSRGREEPEELVRHKGQPGVLLVIDKKGSTGSLKFIKSLKAYIASHNEISRESGVKLILVDDQTPRTEAALKIMENNAVVGLVLVMLTTWLFLGSRISFFIGIGIPFTLAGTFLLLYLLGESLNISVFLGVVIALGMLVDDAVVVVEAIYYRLQRGVAHAVAVSQGLSEVAAPVATSVLTTIAAFLPLMLTPGILGKFMYVIPLVVTIALLISLFEAFWILPVHVMGSKTGAHNPSPLQRYRVRFAHYLRVKYTHALITLLKRPKRSVLAILLLVAAFGVLAGSMVRTDFFAADPIRLFYVNVEMAPNTTLDETLRLIETLDSKVGKHLKPEELRQTVGYAGMMFTGAEVLSGDQYGQVVVSLKPQNGQLRSVDETIETMRKNLVKTPGPVRISFLRISEGPPVSRPISIKVRGDDLEKLHQAVAALEATLQRLPGVKDITSDNIPGKLQLNLRLNGDAIKRSGLDPASVTRIIRLLFDGEIVASTREQGEKLEVRVRAKRASVPDINALFRQPIALPGGGEIALGRLVEVDKSLGQVAIRHYNFRRTITLEADINREMTDVVAVNEHIQQEWENLRARFPGIDLDFSGAFEDIQESIQALTLLFLLGIGLIYLILGTQFRSYWQPLIILAAVPMAFTGVLFGLMVTRNPLSLYTLYGAVALTGIAVNAAIVLIVAANERLNRGMSVLHAAVYAARRRLIPILITSLSTIAGLFALATGLGGRSLLWGPMASAIVWGVGISTLLTLFVIPLLYQLSMTNKNKGYRP
ncbi:Acriflavin resistance protein [Nitrosococcus oceani ATCC 19707]|uniref:Acriflavin resistance protein n=2 Tax=Nitrosococcus oceani TaxID=1229 RepID=Q3J9P1_NITOC|nr:efflux RND transporter permease subunit [Nitrosococcus oceani]ABA58455.1 Acriflavin resistance protein [Nitrosococcus oceani ATCC 19707]EDZ67445.1 RND transporter, HAE1/HME family, permease protein [Nitrosococcus oceani AFC27]KFI19057.1 cation transporter [Nitrosococcus oceani C-27]GEM18850.1 cation transporter [Nitrosococcus oceani]